MACIGKCGLEPTHVHAASTEESPIAICGSPWCALLGRTEATLRRLESPLGTAATCSTARTVGAEDRMDVAELTGQDFTQRSYDDDGPRANLEKALKNAKPVFVANFSDGVQDARSSYKYALPNNSCQRPTDLYYRWIEWLETMDTVAEKTVPGGEQAHLDAVRKTIASVASISANMQTIMDRLGTTRPLYPSELLSYQADMTDVLPPTRMEEVFLTNATPGKRLVVDGLQGSMANPFANASAVDLLRWRLPDTIFSMDKKFYEKVKEVEIRGLRIDELQPFPTTMKGVTSVIISNLSKTARVSVYGDDGNTGMTKIPPFLHYQPKLETLILENQDIADLTVYDSQFKKLTMLVIKENQISQLAVKKGGFPKLKLLDLSTNTISTMTVDPGAMPALETLLIPGNMLEMLYIKAKVLPRLMVFDLHANQISDVVFDKGALPSLRTLDISGNMLTKVPATILVPKKLVEIKMKPNKMKTISYDAQKSINDFRRRRKSVIDIDF